MLNKNSECYEKCRHNAPFQGRETQMNSKQAKMKKKKKQVWNEDHPCRFLSLPHAINLKQPDHWHIHPLDCMRFAMENITLALCCCSVHIPSPFPPLSQPSLSNDRSITATICGDVIFFESEREGFCHVHLLWFVEHSSALTFAWLSDRQEKLISFRWIGKKEAVVKQIYFLNKSILFNLQYVMIICLNLLFTHFNKRQPFFPYKWAQRFEAHFGL